MSVSFSATITRASRFISVFCNRITRKKNNTETAAATSYAQLAFIDAFFGIRAWVLMATSTWLPASSFLSKENKSVYLFNTLDMSHFSLHRVIPTYVLMYSVYKSVNFHPRCGVTPTKNLVWEGGSGARPLTGEKGACPLPPTPR